MDEDIHQLFRALPNVLQNIVNGYLYWKQRLLEVADSEKIKAACWPVTHHIVKSALSQRSPISVENSLHERGKTSGFAILAAVCLRAGCTTTFRVFGIANEHDILSTYASAMGRVRESLSYEGYTLTIEDRGRKVRVDTVFSALKAPPPGAAAVQYPLDWLVWEESVNELDRWTAHVRPPVGFETPPSGSTKSGGGNADEIT